MKRLVVKNHAEAVQILESYWTEHQHQVRVVEWCRNDAPAPLRNRARFIFAIPNGGLRNKAVAGKLQAEGVLPGIPDLFLPVPSGREHGLWVEMKRFGERPKPEQVTRLAELRKNGYRAVVAQGWREAVHMITDYLEQP